MSGSSEYSLGERATVLRLNLSMKPLLKKVCRKLLYGNK